MKSPKLKKGIKRTSRSNNKAPLDTAKLLDIVQRIAGNSTSKNVKEFDARQWLGKWIQQPQPALNGRRPAELLSTPAGVETVARVLRAAESGVYL